MRRRELVKGAAAGATALGLFGALDATPSSVATAPIANLLPRTHGLPSKWVELNLACAKCRVPLGRAIVDEMSLIGPAQVCAECYSDLITELEDVQGELDDAPGQDAVEAAEHDAARAEEEAHIAQADLKRLDTAAERVENGLLDLRYTTTDAKLRQALADMVDVLGEARAAVTWT